MRITQLKIENFRGFGQFEMTFPDNNLAVFIGNNGKGKSSLLDAVAILLTPLTNMIDKKFPLMDNYKLTNSDINNQHKFVSLEVNIEFNTNIYSYERVINSPKNSKINSKNDNGLIDLRRSIVENINPNISIPILCYYKATRTTLFERFNYRGNNSTTEHPQFEAYKNAFSKNNINFNDFITWFRLEEDKENANIRRERDFSLTNPLLEVIRTAMPIFFEHLYGSATYSNLRVERDSNNFSNKTNLIITKDEIDFELEQLSDGEKVLLMTVCDIARRLAIANPKSEPLNGEGIVFIDELELHLHPQWQRTIVPALQATFPNIQFLLTTHSPQVLSEVPQESIFILEDGIIKKPALNNFGRDSNTILEDIMQTSKRPIKIEQFSQAYFRAINANDFEKADALKQEWVGILDKNDPIFVQGQALITRKQLLAQ